MRRKELGQSSDWHQRPSWRTQARRPRAANPAFPAPERYREACLTPTPPSTLPNPQTTFMQPKRENPPYGKGSASGMTVRSYGALSPQGDDNIFFAIKIPLKLRPRKIQRRKLFKLGEILFLAITMCAFQQKLFLLPPPAGCRELSLPALWFHIHTEPRSLPWPSKLFPGWSFLLCPLPTLSSWLPHTFQTSLQAFTYNVTSRESSFPNPMAHVPR